MRALEAFGWHVHEKTDILIINIKNIELNYVKDVHFISVNSSIEQELLGEKNAIRMQICIRLIAFCRILCILLSQSYCSSIKWFSIFRAKWSFAYAKHGHFTNWFDMVPSREEQQWKKDHSAYSSQWEWWEEIYRFCLVPSLAQANCTLTNTSTHTHNLHLSDLSFYGYFA